MAGFTYFDSKPIVVDTEEVAADKLTAAQKQDILNAFSLRKDSLSVRFQLRIRRDVIENLYRRIERIERNCREAMRGETVVTPATFDAEGKEVTPIVYNKPPTTVTELKAQVNPKTNPFTASVIDKIIAYSKYDGKGDFAFYASEIVK